MEIRELRYITEIAKTRHMSIAANNLYISQPALHKALKKVEEELGTEIFYKNKNELLPTDAGIVVLKQAARILNSVNNMNEDIAEIKNLKQGIVRIGYPTIVGEMFLVDPLLEFLKAYPGIKLEAHEAGGSTLASMISNGKLDLAIIMSSAKEDILNPIPIVQDQIAIRVKRHHPLATKDCVNISDLKGYPICTFDKSFNMRNQLDELFAQNKIVPNIEIDCESSYFLYQYSKKSDGILVLPKPIIEFFSDGKDIIIPIEPSFKWELALISPKNDYITKASQTLIEYLQNYFSSHYILGQVNQYKNLYKK